MREPFLFASSRKAGLGAAIVVALACLGGCQENDVALTESGPSIDGSTDGVGGEGHEKEGGPDDSAGTRDGSGTDPGQGTPMRPQLTNEQASHYTILKYFERGGDLAAPVTDNWDPTDGIGDVTILTPRFTVAPSGGTHTTVQSAIDAAVSAGGSDRIDIAVAPGTYRGMVCVPASAPPLTLYGTDPDPTATVIVNDAYSGKTKANGESANPCNPNLSGTTYGTSGSATFAVYANDFRAKSLTLSNDTDEAAVGAASGVQAVALMTQGDKLIFDNVRVLGNQDTLYVKSPGSAVVSRAYFKNCYVEGDVDFVFGRGTVVLDDCELKYLATRVPAGSGNVIAPSTDARNPYGMLVIHSRFTAQGAAAGTAYLGRAWDEGAGDLAGYAAAVATGIYPNGQALIRDSVLDAQVRPLDPWRAAATTNRPYSSTAGMYPANRLYEHENTGPGSAPR
jgi:pectinesterase